MIPIPTVSFVVPCYKFAHLLGECVNSILCQSYGDFEVLIMDDCSPDNSQEVAQSFRDPRVKYIRNEQNLGHLRNFNKGIGLARGKYVWLISADDYLRRSYILQRYVSVLDRYPRVGYTFCSCVGVRNGMETGILEYSVNGKSDRIINGRVFLKELLRANTIVAGSGMARRECYERIGYFPLDMPWAHDWYLWCAFALVSDVCYFAEPMVCYREHNLSITKLLMREKAEDCAAAMVAMPWMVKRKAAELGCRTVVKRCLDAAAGEYVKCITSPRYQTVKMTLAQFADSLSRNASSEAERNWVDARVYAGIGDQYYWAGKARWAKRFYLAGLQKDPWMLRALTKWLLLLLGNLGDEFRKSIRFFRGIKIFSR